jgi:hypothetical protein
MDSSRKARFGGMKFQRGCSLTFGLFVQAFPLLALMAFAGEAPVCISGLMPCLPIGVSPPRYDLLTHHLASCLALLQNDFFTLLFSFQ